MKKTFLLKDVDSFSDFLTEEEIAFFKRKTKSIKEDVELTYIIEFIDNYLFFYGREDYEDLISICDKIEKHINTPQDKIKIVFFKDEIKYKIKKFDSETTLKDVKNWIVKNKLNEKDIYLKMS